MKQDNPPTAMRALRRIASIRRPLALKQVLRAAAVAAAMPLLPLSGAENDLIATDSEPVAKTASPAAAAPKATEPAVRLAPVVVVASRTPELLSEVSPSVSRLDVLHLADAGNYTLADALRTEQGLFTLGDAVGNVQSIFIRGLEARMALVTLDGRRLNPGFANFDASVLGTEGLNSIEIMRGASSTMHGADASGGVIGLNSTNALEVIPKGKVSTGTVFGEGGSYGFTRGGLEVAVAGNVKNQGEDLGKLGISIGGSWTESDGWRENSAFRSITLLPRLDWQINKTARANLVIRHNDYKSGMPGDTGSPTPNDRFESSNTLVSPGIFLDINPNLQVSAFYSYTRNEYRAIDAWGGDYNTAEGHEETLQASYRLNEKVRLAGGFTTEYKQYERVGQGFKGYYASAAPWVQAQITPLKDFDVTVAARHNFYSDYKDATTGELNLRYLLRKTGTSFHGRIANAYNTPDLGTISYDLSYGFGAAAHFRTADLKPEQNLAFEIGAKQNIKAFDGASVGITLFQNNLTDLISWDWGNRTAYNVNKAQTQGIELTGDVRINQQLRLFGNATWLDTEDRSTGRRLVRRPDFSGTIGAEITAIERAVFGFSVTYVRGLEDNLYDYATYQTSRVDLKDYFYARIYATIRLHGGVEVFGRVENFFDKAYSAAAGYPAPPVTASVGLRYRW